ncbi:ABC1 family protein [Ascobolus immersus RN42]|uniref:ABC1 family protein n=1 Tax=Ascobolus immersus RN42 TaxID=1160509 RepID=A0A3N4I1N5_ASCIM|nr:ABC1 family protein [Ascobolus immersus RN42]
MNRLSTRILTRPLIHPSSLRPVRTPSAVLNRLSNPHPRRLTQLRFPKTRSYSTSAEGIAPEAALPKAKSNRKAKLVAAAIATSLGLLAFGYSYGVEVMHTIPAAQRAGRVAWALALCIRDYRQTLKILEDQPDDPDGLLSACHTRCAKRTYHVLEKNGSIFIKLGQHLTSMGYLLPVEWTVWKTVFIPLQDRCPVSSYEAIEQMILKDTGRRIEDIFEEFDPTPLGAASLAQVHRAKLKGSGQEVAVKLQHPSLAEWIPLDIALTRFAFTNIRYFFPEYPLTWLSDEIESSLPQELDFTMEAANITRTRQYFSRLPSLPLIVPNVIQAHPRILIMDHQPGHRLDDLAYLDSHNISRDEVSAALSRIFNEMIFGRDAPLHCDPHGGNLAVRVNHKRPFPLNFDIILYDHGLYRDIPTPLRRNYARLWLAVLDADTERMQRYASLVAGVTEQEFPLFASAITGREFAVVTKSVAIPRDDAEKQNISNALSQGMLAEIVQLLAKVPPIILLILKTNDLTRSLDESLHTTSGPERTFLILARYCSRTVYEEQMEELRGMGIKGISKWVGALYAYWRVAFKLRVYETFLYWRGRIRFALNRGLPMAPKKESILEQVKALEPREVEIVA